MFCRLARWRIDSALDEGRPPTASVEAHMEGCDACRLHYEAGTRLGGTLEREAARARLEPPPGLAERAIAAVRRKAASPSRGRAILRPCLAGLACCAFVAAVAVFLAGARRAREGAKVRETAQELSELGTLLGSLPFQKRGPAASPLSRWEKIVPDNALAGEIGDFCGDIQAAGSFILDCIPRPPMRNGS